MNIKHQKSEDFCGLKISTKIFKNLNQGKDTSKDLREVEASEILISDSAQKSKISDTLRNRRCLRL